MNDLMRSSLGVIALMMVAFFAGGLVFSPNLRAKAAVFLGRFRPGKAAAKPKKAPAGPPDWAVAIPVDPPATVAAPPNNGQVGVEEARRILKKHGYHVRKKRSH